MSLGSIILIGVIFIIFIISILAGNYKERKDSEYKNDERWLAIKDKVNKKLATYHGFLLFCTAVAMAVGTIISGNEILYVDFERMIMVIFLMLVSRDLVELFFLRKYDGTM